MTDKEKSIANGAILISYMFSAISAGYYLQSIAAGVAVFWFWLAYGNTRKVGPFT